MLNKKYDLIYLVGISLWLVYLGLLCINYKSIPDIITAHIGYDGVGSKAGKHQLIYSSIVNFCLLLIILFAMKNEKYWNLPDNFAINIKNGKMFFAFLSVIITVFFSFMIFKALNFNISDVIILLIFVVIIPIILIFLLFKKK